MRPSARMSRVRSLWELHQTALRACSAHVDPFRLTCSLTPTLMETRAHHTANYMSRLHPVASGGLIALLVIAPFLVSIAAVQALQGRIRETRALVKASRIQERLLRGYIRTAHHQIRTARESNRDKTAQYKMLADLLTKRDGSDKTAANVFNSTTLGLEQGNALQRARVERAKFDLESISREIQTLKLEAGSRRGQSPDESTPTTRGGDVPPNKGVRVRAVASELRRLRGDIARTFDSLRAVQAATQTVRDRARRAALVHDRFLQSGDGKIRADLEAKVHATAESIASINATYTTFLTDYHRRMTRARRTVESAPPDVLEALRRREMTTVADAASNATREVATSNASLVLNETVVVKALRQATNASAANASATNASAANKDKAKSHLSTRAKPSPKRVSTRRCSDDPYGEFKSVGLTCTRMIKLHGCAYELAKLSSRAHQGVRIRDICRRSCGDC